MPLCRIPVGVLVHVVMKLRTIIMLRRMMICVMVEFLTLMIGHMILLILAAIMIGIRRMIGDMILRREDRVWRSG